MRRLLHQGAMGWSIWAENEPCLAFYELDSGKVIVIRSVLSRRFQCGRFFLHNNWATKALQISVHQGHSRAVVRCGGPL